METKIAFSPRGNKVLLRADFEVSTLNILNNEEINKIPAKSYTVRAIAENVKGLKVGDKVIYSKYAGTEVKLDGEEYIIVRQNDILAVVE